MFLYETLGNFFLPFLYLAVIYLSMKNKCSMLSGNIQKEENLSKQTTHSFRAKSNLQIFFTELLIANKTTIS